MDNNASGTGAQSKSVIDGIIGAVKGVITNPVEFFRTMPKTGGFGDPLVFAVVIGVVVGIIQAVIGFVTIQGALRYASLGAIVMGPIGALIGSFIGAAIIFVIWKIMGSNENYETAYRCTAYSYAIAPITVLVGLIPYVGSLVGLVWGLYLIVTASVEVHKIPAKKAWMVFGTIAVVIVLVGGCTRLVARKAASSMDSFSREMQKAAKEMEKGNAEVSADASKTAASMMKVLEIQARQAKLQADKDAKESKSETDVAEKDTAAGAAEKSVSGMGTEAEKAAAAMSKMVEAQMRLARIQAEKAAKEAQAEADKAEKDANK